MANCRGNNETAKKTNSWVAPNSQSIAESLAQNSLSRSSSHGSLVSIGSSASGTFVGGAAPTSPGKQEGAAVLQVSSSEHVTEAAGNTMQTTVAGVQNSEAKHKGCESHFPLSLLLGKSVQLYVYRSQRNVYRDRPAEAKWGSTGGA